MSSRSGRRRRPQEFKLPNGKKVIATLPEELDSLRQKYANHEFQVEVVLHGSDEHHSYLKQSRDHHEDRRSRLRERHGPAFDEWEDVQNQLDTVTTELERLTNKTSELSANFSKFGYDANLRAYGDDSPGPSSSRASLSDAISEKTEMDNQRLGETIKLFKRPVVKQWFHRGLLWRASEQTEIMAIELFFDLLYVGILETNGEHLAEDPNGRELLRFVVTFVMSWKIWTDITQNISWFETDDVVTRLEILFEIACLLGFTTNMTYSFYEDEEHSTYTPLVAFYLAARLKSAVHYGVTAYLLPMIKGVMICQVVATLIPCALWIASIHVEMPARLGFVFVALFLDTYGQGVTTASFRYVQVHGENTRFGKLLAGFFEFYPAINIEHKVERTNAFVSLVLGYSVVGVIFQSYGGYPFNAFLGKAVLGLIQAFIFNWIYFDIDGNNINLHAIRRHATTAIMWQAVHLPFIMGYTLASAGLSKLVLTTDVPNTNSEQLSEKYHDEAEEHIANGIRFFYCHGLAIALLSMAAISLSHDHRTPPTLRWNKGYRLANRVAVCIVMFFLPMAHSLRSLDLIAISLGLTIWVLLVELWGKSCKDDPFVGEKNGCCVRYSAKCRKRDLEDALILGGPERRSVDVVALDKKEKTATTLQD